jgi:site-specific DNA-methyltransferase (adenine-specific)
MLQLDQHRPDILEVIGDLSSDEVFTPPRVANAVLDLLPDNVWSDPTLRWLDPGCKTGVFLREITKRLMIGLEDAIPDDHERLEHILQNMVYAIAITELTGLMSRRTVYCSKQANGEHSTVKFDRSAGNVWHGRIEHSYEGERCTECFGAKARLEIPGRDNYAYAFIHESGRTTVEREFNTMKFDVIVGNPPYQMEADAAGQNIAPIYNRFVDQAKALNPRFITMVIPSRWMAGGKWLDDFRIGMLTDARTRVLVVYPNASEVFPSVDIKGGVCYFLWDRDDPGPCRSTYRRGGVVQGPVERALDEFGVFVRDSRALPILRKVLAAGEPSFAGLVSARDPFGPALSSNFKGYRTKKRPEDVRLYMNDQARRGRTWVDPAKVTKNLELVDTWKVLIPKSGPGNSGGHVLPDMVLGQPLTAEPGSVCTLTYLTIGPLESESECESVESYIRTRFLRFLVSLRKPTQDAPRGTYAWVPQQSWGRTWTDEELYQRYGITDGEQEYIAEMVRNMPA